MSILTVIMIIVGLAILIGFIILIGNVSAAILIPPQKCPNCNEEMKIIMSNIYTGQVLYECPKCHKRVSYHYDEEELVRESDGFTCPLHHKKSENDKR